MKKKGVSAIVATVLVVLIAVVGIGLIWGVVLPVIDEGFSAQEYDIDLVIDDSAGYTYYDADNKVACVQIKRGADEFNLSRIDVFFYFNGTSYGSNFTGSDVPGPNEIRKKCFNLEDYGAPNSIEIASVIWDDGKEIIGKVSSAVARVKLGSYPGTPTDIATLDKPKKQNNNGPAPVVCVGGCDDGNDCTVDVCTDGSCSNDDVADGTVCTDGGSCLSGTCILPDWIEISDCSSVVLNEEGATYILVKDIDSTGTCLLVGADGITVDLNGFEIRGEAEWDSYGVIIDGQDNTIVRNGGIYNYDTGVFLDWGSESNTVDNMVISDNLDLGVHILESTNNNIINNIIDDVWGGFGYGVYVEGASSGYNNIINNTIEDVSAVGVSIESSGNKVINNTIISCSVGIRSFGGSSLEIFNNKLQDNGGRGIDFWGDSDGSIIGNYIHSNGLGIDSSTSGNVYIEDNILNANGQGGFYISTFSPNTYVIKNNSIVGDGFNTGISVSSSMDEATISIEDNVVNSSSVGIFVEQGRGFSVYNNILESNDVGLKLAGWSSGGNHDISGNHVCGNDEDFVCDRHFLGGFYYNIADVYGSGNTFGGDSGDVVACPVNSWPDYDNGDYGYCS
mgnify:FL=1